MVTIVTRCYPSLRIGDIPLRELVYRVHPLPPAMRPLVWDFGTMDNQSEQDYTVQMLRSRIPCLSDECYTKLQEILASCQEYLRRSNFGFVSLRDVSRFIQVCVSECGRGSNLVFLWFQTKMELFSEVALFQNVTLPPMEPSVVPLAAVLAGNSAGLDPPFLNGEEGSAEANESTCMNLQSDPDLVTSSGERVLVTKSGWP
eukprot:sb/3470654/